MKYKIFFLTIKMSIKVYDLNGYLLELDDIFNWGPDSGAAIIVQNAPCNFADIIDSAAFIG